MTLQFAFESDPKDPAGSFAAYRRLYAVGSDVERGAGPFRARVRAVKLDGLILFERELSGVVHTRSARVDSDGFDHFALHLVRGGRLGGSRESGFDSAGPGELVVADTRRPSRTEAHDVHLLTVSVPRPVIAAVSGAPARLHGARASAPHTLVLADLMQSLVRHAPALAPAAHPPLRRALVEAIGAALSGVAGAARRRSRSDLRQAAIDVIGQRLGDRGLDAAAVAAAIGSSRSSVYRIFARSGGLAEYVMERRLAAVREVLEAGSTRPLAELAADFGFADESHLNRRFVRAFGRPAGAFRPLGQGGGDPVARAAHQMRRWVETLD